MTVSTEVDHNDYIGNGVTTSFPYTFRIFKKSDLVVQVVDLNENITELILDTDYTVTGAGGYTGGNVVLSSPLANGYQISISRELPVTQETDLRNQGKFFAEVHEDAFDKLTMLIQQAYSVFRLALRKPSSVSNWYDALNNYIRNLRDPRDPQDAATKHYVDSSITDNTSGWQAGDAVLDQKINANYSRTLRVPENSIPVLSGAAQRANKLFAWDNSGNPIEVLPESGSAADVLIELAKPTGAALVKNGNETVASQLDRTLKRTTVAEVATGLFRVDDLLTITDRADGNFRVVSGGTPNGTYILNAGNGNTAVYQIPSDGYVRVKALGGRSGVDSTAAIVAAHSLSNLVHYDDDDVYELAYDVNTSNKSLISYINQNYVRITGSSATIKDVSVFSSGVSFLVNIFRFSSCKNVFVGVNFDATPLADITAPSPDGIGYKGSTAIYLEGFCNNVRVDNVMSNIRHGVRIGGYSDPSLGGSRNVSLRTRCFQVGYPIASYTVLNLVLDIYSNIQHRAAYLGGAKNVSGNITLAGFTYATISVLFTDSIRTVSATDIDRRVNSCQNVHLNINDNGSTGTTSARALWGMQQEWKAPNLDHQDIHCHINMATNNATRTYAAVRIQEIDTIGWMAGNKYTNIKCSGVVDRSAQSLTGSSWADYSIVGIAAADGAGPTYPNSPVFDGIDFSELRIINGGVTGNLSQILAPNATGVINLKNARQGISLSTQAPNARIILTNASFSSVTGVGVIYPSINKSSNGYRVDDDGNIDQWMKVNYTASSGSAQSFTFPIPFLTSCSAVTATVIGTGYVTSTGTPTTSGVSISCSTTGVSLFIRATGF